MSDTVTSHGHGTHAVTSAIVDIVAGCGAMSVPYFTSLWAEISKLAPRGLRHQWREAGA